MDARDGDGVYNALREDQMERDPIADADPTGGLLLVGQTAYALPEADMLHRNSPRRVVLGIDPGSLVMGYAVLVVDPAARSETPSFVVAGAIMLSQYREHYQRLGAIHARVSQLIASYHPTEMAIEAPFFGKNAQSMLKLGRAQGVAIAAGIGAGLPITEYAPRKVKIAVTGAGGASKQQVASMLYRLFPGQGLEQLRFEDATDGLAVALCHAYSIPACIPQSHRKSGNVRPPLGERSTGFPKVPSRKKHGDWNDFIRSNPSRVKGSSIKGDG